MIFNSFDLTEFDQADAKTLVLALANMLTEFSGEIAHKKKEINDLAKKMDVLWGATVEIKKMLGL